MRLIFAALALGLATVPGHAQLAVYGGFTTSKLSTANTPRLNGATFGALYDSPHSPWSTSASTCVESSCPSRTQPESHW